MDSVEDTIIGLDKAGPARAAVSDLKAVNCHFPCGVLRQSLIKGHTTIDLEPNSLLLLQILWLS